jgi:hypothetical protein
MRRTSAILILSLLFIPIAGFAAPPFASPFLLRHGALVDASRGAAYVAKPNGTIDSVDLASGRTLWSSADAALPLGVDQDVLLAQAEEKPQASERFQVVILNAADGRKVSDATITLPAGARALVADEKRESFRATAEREGALFLVSWVYTEVLAEAVPPSPGEPAWRLVAGSAHISSQTGKVVTADGGPVDDLPARWKTYASPPRAPWRAGNVLARAEGGRLGPLTLKRTDAASGRPLPDQALSKKAVTAVPSADQRHLLASERAGEGGPDDPEYRWRIFANDTGELVTELRRNVSAAPFFVFTDSVIYEARPYWYLRGTLRVEEPLKIEAVRLSSGVPSWNVELRDLSYHGKRPPTR